MQRAVFQFVQYCQFVPDEIIDQELKAHILLVILPICFCFRLTESIPVCDIIQQL